MPVVFEGSHGAELIGISKGLRSVVSLLAVDPLALSLRGAFEVTPGDRVVYARTPGAVAASRGDTPLMTAVFYSGTRVEIVKLLLDGSADLAIRNSMGESVLYRAVNWGGSVDIVRVLLDRGARTDAPDTFGKTPLQAAREKGYKEIVGLLEKRGAK